MSEKETPEIVEEDTTDEVIEKSKELEASENEEVLQAQSVEEEVSEQDESSEEVSDDQVETAAEESVEPAPKTPPVKKGLMERRPSFSQSSVPNAHKGYSSITPVIMMLIVSVFLLLSIIFATASIN